MNIPNRGGTFKDRALLVLSERVARVRYMTDIVHCLGVWNRVVADSAAQALAQMARTRIDAVLLDLAAAPRRQFLSALRAHSDEVIRRIPVIVMQENASLADVQSCRDAGANAFLCSPLTLKAVEQKLEDIWLRKRGFVDDGSYTGPDRRCPRAGTLASPKRRTGEAAQSSR